MNLLVNFASCAVFGHNNLLNCCSSFKLLNSGTIDENFPNKQFLLLLKTGHCIKKWNSSSIHVGVDDVCCEAGVEGMGGGGAAGDDIVPSDGWDWTQ